MAVLVWSLSLIVIVVFDNVTGSELNKSRENLFSSGIKIVNDFLGSESVALKVADIVVRAFQNNSRNKRPVHNHLNKNKDDRRKPSHHNAYDDFKEDASENRPNTNAEEVASSMTPLQQLVKLFGLQSTQISAVAVNALLFIAQMIATFLSEPRRPQRPLYRNEDPMTWILNKNSKKLQDLIAAAKNESLPEILEELIKEQSSDKDISCIQLLACKITPFISKMQYAVFGNGTDTDPKKHRGAAAMYRNLPSLEEIKERSRVCEDKYKNCDLNQF